MALRLSTATRNFILQHGSLRDMLQNGVIKIYSGTQPASANTAPSGTELAKITASSGTHTAEVQATGTATLAGTSGSVDAMTVDGFAIMDNAVAFITDLSTTATAVAAEINNSLSHPEYTATAASAVVTVTAKRGAGATANSLVLATTLTTMTSTDVDLASGVTPLNGLKMGNAAAGTIVKDPNQTWSGAAGASGTAGWFRFSGSVADGEGTDSSEAEIRIDGAIATSGAELNLPSTTVTSAATQTITSLQFSLPAS